MPPKATRRISTREQSAIRSFRCGSGDERRAPGKPPITVNLNVSHLQSARDSFQIAPMTMPAYKIDVVAKSVFLPEQSDEEGSRYMFAYTIKVANNGTIGAQLLSRHWIITDSNGRVQEVRGEGVVGEQPHLEPGAVFEYSSSASLETPVGTMRGSYQMVAADGTRFEAAIPEFTLSIPRVLH